MSLKWKGKDIQGKMGLATRIGINRTMGKCIIEAKNNHPWKNRTGTAERSIRMAIPARTLNKSISYGVWGSVQNNYFASLEFGSKPHVIVPRRAKMLSWVGPDGQRIFARKVNHPGNKKMPALVPAAVKHYPSLGEEINRAFKSL